MTCKECVHYDICEMLRPIEWCTGKTCLGFKNKANFVELPCKVGQTVWFIRDEKIIETKVEKIVLKNKGVYLKLGCNAMYETSCNSIGKTLFLTKEEAEQKLKGGAVNE